MAEPRITLTNRQILKLVEGLKSLDGVSNEAQKIERFDFDENLGWNVAKDRHLCEEAEEVYKKSKASLAARLGVVENMKLTPENAAAVAKFIEQNNDRLEKTQELNGILKISRSALFKAGVKIPGIYTCLMPILVD